MTGGERTRRRFLQFVGGTTAAVLAGCAGGPGTGGTTNETATSPETTPETATTEGTETTEEPTETTVSGTGATTADEGGEPEEELPPGVSQEQFDSGPVPEQYRTAVSQGGEARDPNNLRAKAEVNFGEAEDLAPPNQRCANCSEFIPFEDSDVFGACAKVEGYVATEDWCALWEELPETTTQS